jgi:threonine dehydrogenase-like Zn-dependent dehydrogenase
MEAVGVTRHGAFAQYLTVPERCVFDIKGLSFTEGSMVEPLSCVVYGQEKSGIPLGASVLIFGAGPIGLMHAQLAGINGAASVTVVDLFEDKLALAKKLGVDHTYTSSEFEKLGLVNSFEVVIDCTGVPKVVEGAVKYVKDAGTMIFFGVCPDNSAVSINPYEVFKRELRLVGTFALKKTFGKALALARSGKLNLIDLVDKKLLLDDAPKVFEEVVAGNSGLKTIFYPNGVE